MLCRQLTAIPRDSFVPLNERCKDTGKCSRHSISKSRRALHEKQQCVFISETNTFPRQPGSTGGTSPMESHQCIDRSQPACIWVQFMQTCRTAPTDFMIISSVATCHCGNSVTVCHNFPTRGRRRIRAAKLSWFVLASGLQCDKRYLWLSHTNLVASILSFCLIFSTILSTIYMSRMHKQSTWHLEFILVRENLIDE